MKQRPPPPQPSTADYAAKRQAEDFRDLGRGRLTLAEYNKRWARKNLKRLAQEKPK